MGGSLRSSTNMGHKRPTQPRRSRLLTNETDNYVIKSSSGGGDSPLHRPRLSSEDTQDFANNKDAKVLKVEEVHASMAMDRSKRKKW